MKASDLRSDRFCEGWWNGVFCFLMPLLKAIKTALAFISQRIPAPPFLVGKGAGGIGPMDATQRRNANAFAAMRGLASRFSYPIGQMWEPHPKISPRDVSRGQRTPRLLSVCVRVLRWLLLPFFASRVSRLALCLVLGLSSVCAAAIGGGQANVGKVLIPMDVTQTDHLKAYGIAFWALQEGHPVEWLLNYRGGAFLMDFHETIAREARIRAVSFQAISAAQATRIYADIESANMNRMHLEKAPRIAVYTPPHKQPWDDAVTLALTYAEIPYTTLWDEEVLSGQLEDYDWLHLHHEDFTGQYGKFYRSHGRQLWYRRQQAEFEALARKLGFAKVSQLKGAVARAIYNYVAQGGFLFAMCSATDTFDIALAAGGVDIVDGVYDGDPADPMARQKLDFSRTVAFENFDLVMDPLEYEYADIDLSPTEMSQIKDADLHAFSLFEFSAKYDPVPTMLTQNHTPIVPGFLGQTTAFRKDRIKKSVTIMGDIPGTNHVKYIHGNIGRGTFTFYAGHDPEDYQHFVNDPPTQLALHKNSPGYRLILNNILFPAAKKEKRKT